MYKIYINGTRLILAGDDEMPKELTNSDKIMVTAYPGQARYLHNYVDMIEKSGRFDKVYIHHSDFKVLLKDFKRLYKTVPAAGGMVVNEDNEILFIHRRGSWDLPKGKMESGESKSETALREVEEETGVLDLTLGKKITKTKHLYKGRSGKRFVKKTHWYVMRAAKQKLIPQTEEDILEAVWMTLDQWAQVDGTTYENIKLVLKKGKKILNEVSKSPEES